MSGLAQHNESGAYIHRRQHVQFSQENSHNGPRRTDADLRQKVNMPSDLDFSSFTFHFAFSYIDKSPSNYKYILYTLFVTPALDTSLTFCTVG